MSAICQAIMLLVTVTVAVSLQAGEIYFWTDEAGRTYYADRPGHDDARPVTIRPAPEPDPGLADRQHLRLRLLQWFSDERAAQQREAERQAKADRQRRHDCEHALQRLSRSIHAGALYRIDETGDRHIIHDSDERGAVEARARAAVDTYCK